MMSNPVPALQSSTTTLRIKRLENRSTFVIHSYFVFTKIKSRTKQANCVPKLPKMLQNQLNRLARAALFSTLGKIEYGQIRITIAENDQDKEAEVHTFGQPKSPDEPKAALLIRNPAVWLRLCSNLDAVSSSIRNSR
jgi:hypothetical protein